MLLRGIKDHTSIGLDLPFVRIETNTTSCVVGPLPLGGVGTGRE